MVAKTVITDPVAKALLSLDTSPDAVRVVMPIIRQAAGKVIAKFNTTQVNYEDAVQEGTLRVFQAVKKGQYKYDGRPASPWLYTVARFAVLQYVQTATKERPLGMLSLDAETRKFRARCEHYTLGELLPDDDQIDPAEEAENCIDAHDLLQRLKLSKFERKVIECRIAGRTYEEAAEELGCEVKAIDNATMRFKGKVKAFNRLRTEQLTRRGKEE